MSSFADAVTRDCRGPELRVIGGANVPSDLLGRLNGTWPFGVFELMEQTVTLRLRPRWLGGSALVASATEIRCVYRVSSRLPGGYGVGFDHADGRTWYFWSGRADQVLEWVERAGFPVVAEVRRPRKIWSAVP